MLYEQWKIHPIGVVGKGSLVDEYVIYQLRVVDFMRFIVSVMILIFVASALSGCIVGEFVQSP